MKKIISTMKVTAVLIVGLSAFVGYGQAQQFSSFPAETVYTGKQAKLKFSTDNGSDMFKSVISQDVKAGVNYAGEYNIVQIGCGSSCMNAYVVNLKNGNIIKFPLGGELNYQLILQYNTKSRLIKAVWNDTETTPNKACVIEFFNIENDRFLKVQINEENQMTQEKDNNEIPKWKREGYGSQGHYDKWNEPFGSASNNPLLDDIKAGRLRRNDEIHK